ncbi:MAG: DUF1311 domain-containing protein [Rhodobacteraceae bacterium]|nr:DUF1311 domain-containing protein [Paracoccaceae bacterium]
MKNYLVGAILALTWCAAAQADSVPDARDIIRLETCFDTFNNAQLGTCVEIEIDRCWYATGRANISSGQCMSEAFRQADSLLNSYYQRLVPAVRLAAGQLVGSAYELTGNPLRESQRAWLAVRDTTCNLSVVYAATGPGRESHIEGCKARLTMQRIGDLDTELGRFLDSSN